MPRPVPTSRAQVAMQVARGGGPDRVAAAGEAAAPRGRHRTPDTAAPAAPEHGDATPRAAAVPGAPSRHTTAARRRASGAAPAGSPTAGAATPAARAPGTLARVEAARVAAARPEVGRLPDAAGRTPGSVPRGPARSSARSSAPDDDAVTDLVAGLTHRGGGGVPDGPGTGRLPGLLGLVLGVLALLGAVVAAAAPGIALPGVGHLGSSPPALVGLLAAALLATACSGLGAGRHRAGRAVAVTGMVVGIAAVAAAVLPLVAL